MLTREGTRNNGAKKESKQNDDVVDGKPLSPLYSKNSSESALFAYPPACFVPRT